MSKNKNYTPAEAARILDLSSDLIRKYCEYFNIITEWTQPENKGHRRFTKENIESLLEIKKLIQVEKMTWPQTRDYLNGEIEHFFEQETKANLEKKIDSVIEMQTNLNEVLIALTKNLDAISNENQQLIKENQRILLETEEIKREQKQEKSTGFISRLFKRLD